MGTFNDLAERFLSQKNLVVVGVSRESGATANMIYKALLDKGYSVYPVNPQAETIEGQKCYPNIQSIPVKPDGVFLMTRSDATLQVVKECIELGIARVWMHENSFAGTAHSSVNQEAVELCKANNIEVIPGGCPMMFLEFGHKCMRWILGMMGKLPA